MNHYYLGVDIGGTKIEVATLELTFDANVYRIVDRRRRATERELGSDHIVEVIASLIEDSLKANSIDLSQIKSIGLGLPGTIDPETTLMLNGNTEVLIDKPVIVDLRSRLNFSGTITIDNDANLFALAEVFWGAGQLFANQTGRKTQTHQAIGLILGTGTGGGIILNGEILNGRHGGGAEVGHTTLYSDGLPCYCGQKGCAEQYLSGPGIENNYFILTGKKSSSLEIFQGANQGETMALTIINKYQKDLTLFLKNLTNIFDPDYFVLGGGVSTQKIIYENLEERLYEQTFIKKARPKVFRHQIGDSAGVIGAALKSYIQL
jgi:fructokinase